MGLDPGSRIRHGTVQLLEVSSAFPAFDEDWDSWELKIYTHSVTCEFATRIRCCCLSRYHAFCFDLHAYVHRDCVPFYEISFVASLQRLSNILILCYYSVLTGLVTKLEEVFPT
jgi:hypothetical protein